MRFVMFWLALAAALVFSGLLPLDATDASELQPAHVLLIWQEGGMVRAMCDADAEGRGMNLAQAIWDMERTADGELFLDTAEHIIIAERTPQLVLQAAESEKLRPAASVWLMRGEIPNAEQAAAFLKNRGSSVRLSRVRAGMLGAAMPQIPYLMQHDGRLVAIGV